jgi:hypothetical protein
VAAGVDVGSDVGVDPEVACQGHRSGRPGPVPADAMVVPLSVLGPSAGIRRMAVDCEATLGPGGHAERLRELARQLDGGEELDDQAEVKSECRPMATSKPGGTNK